MQTLKIDNSSAISALNFNSDSVGVVYTSNTEKEYMFDTTDVNGVQVSVLAAQEQGQSIGSLINAMRRDGRLTERTA